METKEIGGVLYELVPEEKEESCKGCAFKDPNADICTFLSTNCNKGLIYKKVGEPISTSNLNPFNLEEAKAGKPVCTRDGRKARIICFDRIDSTGLNLPIVALIQCGETEVLQLYRDDGKRNVKVDLALDLMMLPEKKEGWVNVYKTSERERNVGCLYPTKEVALSKADITDNNYISTVKIKWEE